MGLKRKRSITSLSPCSTSSSMSITPQHEILSPTPYSNETWSFGDNDTSMGGVEFGFLSPGDFAPGLSYDSEHSGYDTHMNSRTRKRFRDGRPDERVVHENTLSKLFLAQRPSHQPLAIPTETRPSSVSSTTSSTRSQQTSLHSFWPLPRRSMSSISSAPPPSTLEASFAAIENKRKCEDCDAWIRPLADGITGDGMDLDAGSDGDDINCKTCRRMVCNTCAVVEIGAGRECLGCKTRPRRWVGGIGWVA